MFSSVALRLHRFPGRTLQLSPDTSFFINLLRLYSALPAQAGYGDKWPSE
jgi:hypothetical protein